MNKTEFQRDVKQKIQTYDLKLKIGINSDNNNSHLKDPLSSALPKEIVN